MIQSLSLRMALTLFLVIAVAGESWSETVDVKYRGPVNLTPFKCSTIDRSSFIVASVTTPLTAT
jgi:hypothetical protein